MKQLKKAEKFGTFLSLPAFDGNIILLAINGLITIKNIPLLAFTLISGPAAIWMAATLGGTIRERMMICLIAGLMATASVIMAAALGPKLINFVNMKSLKTTGALAVLSISLILFGLKIPDKTPSLIMIIGLIISIIWR